MSDARSSGKNLRVQRAQPVTAAVPPGSRGGVFSSISMAVRTKKFSAKRALLITPNV